VATGTAHQGLTENTAAETGIGTIFGQVGTTSGGLVVLRDELGILSVMRCLDAGLTLDPAFQYAYPAESAALAGLSDPRLAPPLSYVVDAAGQIVATVCRHVTGVRLSKILAQLPRGLDVQTAAAVTMDVLAAIDALHSRGVAHRAPDADHVIVEPNGNCVLVDAGLVARANGESDPAADVAADLDLAADLFVTCLVPGRLQPERGGRGYFEPDELEGVAARLYTALTDPEPDPDDPGALAEAATAARLYGALESVAADSFDAGWDGRARERLANTAKDHRSARRRVLEFRPSGHTDRRWSIRGWHAGSPRVGRNRQRITASAEVMRQARAQLLELWAGHGRAADRRGAGSHAADGHHSRMVRYLIPLIAFLLAFGLALLFLGSSSNTPAHADLNPAAAAQSTRPPLGTGPGAGTGESSASAPEADDLPKAKLTGKTAPMSTAPTAQHGPYTPPPPASATTTPAAPTTITALDIVSLGYDATQPGKAVVTIDVQTSGTAPLTVTVTFTPTYGFGYPYGQAPQPQTDHFALSGKTKYTVTDTAGLPQYCQYQSQARYVVAAVKVTGIVNTNSATVSNASGNLYSCS
jgi:hypothetical protein